MEKQWGRKQEDDTLRDVKGSSPSFLKLSEKSSEDKLSIISKISDKPFQWDYIFSKKVIQQSLLLPQLLVKKNIDPLL